MKDPALLAMLVVNGIGEGDMARATVPNGPDRACSSCGAGFRARLTRCPGCGSARLARVVHKEESWEVRDELWAGHDGKKATEAETCRLRAEMYLGGRGRDRGVAAEVRRLRDLGAGAAAEWKALQGELGFVIMPRSGAVNAPTLACSECSEAFRPRPVRCPKCGSAKIARIQYGYPARMPDEEEMVELGGCCVSPEDPGMACRSCRHRFGKSGF